MAYGLLRISFVVACLYLVATVTCGLLQADPLRETIAAGEPAEVDLASGDVRNVYLTPEESAAYNFDFYPSDLSCRMRSPGAEVVDGKDLSHEHRFVDGWNRHWGVASFRAEVAGVHTITCTDMSDRTYPLVLAGPPTAGPFVVYPDMSLFLVAVTGILLAVARLLRGRAPAAGAG